MTEPGSEKPLPNLGSTRGCLGMLGVVLVILVVGGASGGWWYQQRQAAELAAQEAVAREQFGPALDQMRPPSEPAGPAYDIDTTVRVIHEIDAAVQNADSLQAWLMQLSRQDYRDVAPEVLEARTEMLEVLMGLYAAQTELEDQQALWDFSSGYVLLSALSMVEMEGDVNLLTPGGSFDVDREQARVLLDDLVERQDEHGRLTRELRQSEAELLQVLVKYSDTYYTYLEEWDRLLVVRDRAYLAAQNRDWDAARAAADEAIRMAPGEREAHLLKALAIIEGADGPEELDEAVDLLGAYIDAHPDRSAPALLLLGVARQRQGNVSDARLLFQQAAAYYPKQADALTDMVDPYRMRSFLRKSREGGYIVELYQSTMLGAGYWSPDLQMARVLFEQGTPDSFEAGRQKVMDHFARRRAQQQWDFILSDLSFCQDLLGEDYRRIFPENHYLDLVVKPGLLGSKLKLAVTNRSDRSLHNATLVLALQFTDMHPSDYHTVIGGQTVPAVMAHESTDFGETEISFELHGVTKGVADIVTHRAILVANEAVVWVDTDAYKIAENKEFRERARSAGASTRTEAPSAVESWTRSVAREVVKTARTDSSLTVTRNFMADDVSIKLPKELVMLRPLFRLKAGDKLIPAETNVIVGDHIELGFKAVGDFETPGETTELVLVAGTPYGDVELTWLVSPNGTVRLKDASASGLEALGGALLDASAR